jgi:hypothetical protein
MERVRWKEWSMSSLAGRLFIRGILAVYIFSSLLCYYV